MIVVDSSALIAIPFEEPEKQAFETAMADSDRRFVRVDGRDDAAVASAMAMRRGGA